MACGRQASKNLAQTEVGQRPGAACAAKEQDAKVEWSRGECEQKRSKLSRSLSANLIMFAHPQFLPSPALSFASNQTPLNVAPLRLARDGRAQARLRGSHSTSR